MIGKKYYSTLQKALIACKKNSKCKAVVRNNKNKYYLSYKPVSGKSKKTNYIIYKKGSSSVAVIGYTYTIYVNYIYKTTHKTVYKTRHLAGKACATKGDSCTGIIYVGKNKYK